MKTIRGTKDILPHEITSWQSIYKTAYKILDLNNYKEIRTPVIENTKLFERSIGNLTDIVNKEMYSFNDQGNRSITLRPEGTASIARSVISNKLYINQPINRLWYMGPMFRYERPQQGRQRQFHQLGIECIGSNMPIADVEVIKIAIEILTKLQCEKEYELEINSIGNQEERKKYCQDLIEYLKKYENDLDEDSKKRIYKNPLRILDSKNLNTQEILQSSPILKNYLQKNSKKHFESICDHLSYLKIKYKINNYLVRGLDYYNHTAFEIKTKTSKQQNTICGGGRYDTLFEQIGGPHIPAVGWAIGIERLLLLKEKNFSHTDTIYIAIQSIDNNNHMIWKIIDLLKEYKIKFELDISNYSLKKQIKKAYQLNIKICFILGENEMNDNFITVKWLQTGIQQQIKILDLRKYIKYLQKQLQS
uniref:Histidine--tRNA ligase, chloroplastic n=1 Tax=Herposiphonia versicolor TaxID=2007163 RepID=A0A1Z1MGI4_9FLOR|nr:Histidine-tRNA ligase [Herposiphonia versicolor]ARW64864.1 Histidine-tRNA ligase [Herposiphonia versicolor]